MAFKKLSKRTAHFLTPLLVSLMMTCIVSAVSVLRAQGLSGQFLHVWLPAWGMSWVIAFPALLLVLPFVRHVVARMTEE